MEKQAPLKIKVMRLSLPHDTPSPGDLTCEYHYHTHHLGQFDFDLYCGRAI